ncbi:MAG: hypothetical protein Edafosvirus2_86 [Edafosvirus sp.]|uniref:G-protein coupled receptors family 1 profile domain-containing protein n=1 Tax=Edafosvirus sp. TaxID=2487765 RepID=A0A3G4ZSN9_9VIRU|nr:MAG: hypothetical protein Edafosvirus2_86 [Edafosvirus sp.]
MSSHVDSLNSTLSHNSSYDDDNEIPYKQAVLSVYVTLHTIGACLSLLLGIYIVKSKTKTASDIFIFGLCLGCIVMSLPCIIECMISLTEDSEYNIDVCSIEALFHLTAIIIQFLNIGLFAWRSHSYITKRIEMSISKAYLIVLLICFLSFTGTTIIGHFSSVYEMPSGTYCFYSYSSLATIAWFIPILTITFISIVYFYTKIILIARRSERAVASLTNNNNSKQVTVFSNNNRLISFQVAKRVIIYICIFMLCWGPGFVAVIYLLIHNNISPYFDVIVACFAASHSSLVPITYGYYAIGKGQKKGNVKIQYAQPARVNVSSNAQSFDSKMQSGDQKTAISTLARQESIKVNNNVTVQNKGTFVAFDNIENKDGIKPPTHHRELAISIRM